ncbi:MAG: hypothetical protein GXO39_01375 [Thermotogae bacterium]|nr:hypothetical protein [Thermotogota bacterium]
MFILVSALTTAPSSGLSLGLVFGDPTGLSLKFWGVGNGAAFQLHTGGGGFVAPAKLAVSGSLLFHATLTHQTPIVGYIGVGAYMGMYGRRDDNYALLGMQMPLGLEILLSDIPLDVFLEIPPIFYFTSGGDVGFGMSMGLGLRFLLR